MEDPECQNIRGKAIFGICFIGKYMEGTNNGPLNWANWMQISSFFFLCFKHSQEMNR